MKTHIFRSCTMFVVLCFAATQSPASAQATPALEGLWSADITPVSCQTGLPLTNVPIHVLNMFGHDGSLTNESASFGPTPLRSSGVGRWDRTQGQAFVATFQFFNYNPDGSFMLRRKVTFTIILLDSDHYKSIHQVQDFDWKNNLISTGCNTGTATRIQ
jgi:hypothetical protein